MAAEKSKEISVPLTSEEIDNLIGACWFVISDYCVGNEDIPYKALIKKLEGVIDNGC